MTVLVLLAPLDITVKALVIMVRQETAMVDGIVPQGRG